MSAPDTTETVLAEDVSIDPTIAAAVLTAPREHLYYACSRGDVMASQAAAADGLPANTRRAWFHSCPQRGTPQCNLYGIDTGPARASCQYCGGRGFCLVDDPSTVEDFASVATLGAERVSWAEDVYARSVASDLGIELRYVLWRVVSEWDVSWDPSCRNLRSRWVYALDASADGCVVLGVKAVAESDLITTISEARS